MRQGWEAWGVFLGCLGSGALGACAHHSRLPVVGTVYDSRQQPINGVVITIARADSENSASQCVNVTRDRGEFACSSLEGEPFKPKRTYVIVLERDGYKPFSTQFEYQEEEERRLIFTLKEPGEVGDGDMGTRVEDLTTGSTRRRPGETLP